MDHQHNHIRMPRSNDVPTSRRSRIVCNNRDTLRTALSAGDGTPCMRAVAGATLPSDTQRVSRLLSALRHATQMEPNQACIRGMCWIAKQVREARLSDRYVRWLLQRDVTAYNCDTARLELARLILLGRGGLRKANQAALQRNPRLDQHQNYENHSSGDEEEEEEEEEDDDDDDEREFRDAMLVTRLLEPLLIGRRGRGAARSGEKQGGLGHAGTMGGDGEDESEDEMEEERERKCAARMYVDAANRCADGDERVTHIAAHLHYDGIGVARDVDHAMSLWRRAAHRCYTPSMLALGTILANQNEARRSNQRRAATASELDSDAGSATDGDRDQEGEGDKQGGDDARGEAMKKEAMIWLEKAIECGSGEAKFILGAMLVKSASCNAKPGPRSGEESEADFHHGLLLLHNVAAQEYHVGALIQLAASAARRENQGKTRAVFGGSKSAFESECESEEGALELCQRAVAILFHHDVEARKNFGVDHIELDTNTRRRREQGQGSRSSFLSSSSSSSLPPPRASASADHGALHDGDTHAGEQTPAGRMLAPSSSRVAGVGTGAGENGRETEREGDLERETEEQEEEEEEEMRRKRKVWMLGAAVARAKANAWDVLAMINLSEILLRRLHIGDAQRAALLSSTAAASFSSSSASHGNEAATRALQPAPHSFRALIDAAAAVVQNPLPNAGPHRAEGPRERVEARRCGLQVLQAAVRACASARALADYAHAAKRLAAAILRGCTAGLLKDGRADAVRLLDQARVAVAAHPGSHVDLSVRLAAVLASGTPTSKPDLAAAHAVLLHGLASPGFASAPAHVRNDAIVSLLLLMRPQQPSRTS